jgi:diguanylate cyclase (GGDEF)-like protein
VLATADTIVAAAQTDPDGSTARLTAFDVETDAMEEPLDALLDQLDALQRAAGADTTSAQQAATRAVLVTSALTVLLLFVLALLAANSILRGLRDVGRAARQLADGDFTARVSDDRGDEIGALGGAFNATADSLEDMLHRLEEQRGRDTFGRQLNEALEMADTEDQTYAALSTALGVVSPDHPVELLVADSSRAHLEARVEHPQAGAPGCTVDSPFGCVAVRRGTTTTFADDRDLNACPKLRGRGAEPLSAVCVPVTFMGRALGVLHTTAPADAPAGPAEVARLSAIASAAGARIGTVRSFERTQLQASTDGLTGLMNRRTFETTARPLVRDGGQFAIVMADVDHFKSVNDTFGHEAGDRALALFADQLRAHLRTEDLLARYGGEEFVMFLPDCSDRQAVELLDRFRDRLAHSTSAHPPAFTARFGVVDSTHPDSLAGYVRRADAALYRAKADGRNRVVVDEGGPTTRQQPQTTGGALERAVREDDPLADLPRMR